MDWINGLDERVQPIVVKNSVRTCDPALTGLVLAQNWVGWVSLSWVRGLGPRSRG